jgi:hypothetical protein
LLDLSGRRNIIRVAKLIANARKNVMGRGLKVCAFLYTSAE